MLLYGILLVPMVLGALDESTANELTVNEFILKIEDKILKNIETSDVVTFELDLSGLDLHGVEANVFESASHIRNLSLANNRISTLPQSVFVPLKYLEHLSLANNSIEEYWPRHPIFQGLNNLTSLNISYNPIKNLPEGYLEGLGQHTDIITLGNAFDTISTRVFERYVNHWLGKRRRRNPETPSGSRSDLLPTGIIDYESQSVDLDRQVKVCIREGVLEKLEAFTNTSELESHCKNISTYYLGTEIILRRLGISKFSAGWYRLQDYPVRYLVLAHNDIVNVAGEMLNDLPKELRYVDLSHNKIETLAKGTINNEHLYALDFTGNNISEIEESVFKNTKLRGLILSGNRLRKATFTATLPPTLTELKLDNNHIHDLSSDFSSGVENLDTLTLARNNITELKTGSLRGLTGLDTLDLTGNKLGKIEKRSFQELGSLRSLTLDENNLTRLDIGIFDGLGNLTSLSLRSNTLAKITGDSLQSLSNLDYLDLSFNQIETLEAGTFVNLPRGSIVLENNKIKKIENGTFDIERLYKLHLRGNFLDQLDAELFNGIRSLDTLDLADNGITKIKKSNFQFITGSLKISKNPIKRLENGALFGLSNSARTIELEGVPIELIQSGVFDDL